MLLFTTLLFCMDEAQQASPPRQDTLQSATVEDMVRKYFSQLYSGARIKVGRKVAERRVIVVDTPQLSPLTYRLETRQLEASTKWRSGIVRPAELLVYKFLDKVGLGAECHFCGVDRGTLYIAMLDFTSIEEEKGKFYTLLECFYGNQSEQSLTGGLSQLGEVGTAYAKAVDQVLCESVQAQLFAEQLVTADIISRLFGLIIHLESFGFTILRGQNSPMLRIVDFMVRNDCWISYGDFLSFLRYKKPPDRIEDELGFFHYIVYSMSEEMRFKMAYSTMEALYKMKGILGEVYSVVENYINQVAGLEKSSLLAQLEVYYRSVADNFDVLKLAFDMHAEKLKKPVLKDQITVVIPATVKSIFGEKILEWGIDWDVIQNSVIAFDAPERCDQISQLCSKIKRDFQCQDNSPAKNLWTFLMRLHCVMSSSYQYAAQLSQAAE